jgi:cation:H+ antiporter
MLLNIVFIVVGLAGLYYGSEWLVIGASRIAMKMKIPPIVIGLTVVAVGTSIPELGVSILASLQGKEGIALGNVIGSNIANIGLILGLTGLIRVIQVNDSLVKREIPIMIAVTFIATFFTLDGHLSRFEGILLLLGFALFNFMFYYIARKEGVLNGASSENIDIDLPEEVEDLSTIRRSSRGNRSDACSANDGRRCE